MSVANSAQARAGFNRWMSKHSFPSNRWKLCLRRDLLPCACPNIKWIHVLIHILIHIVIYCLHGWSASFASQKGCLGVWGIWFPIHRAKFRFAANYQERDDSQARLQRQHLLHHCPKSLDIASVLLWYASLGCTQKRPYCWCTVPISCRSQCDSAPDPVRKEISNLCSSLGHKYIVHICIHIWIRIWKHIISEITCVLKFSDHPNSRISRTLCNMLWAFSKFQPATSPVLSGRLDFKSSKSSTEFCWSFAKSDATSPKRRWRIFHLRAEIWTSMISLLGSSIGLSPCKGDPTGAEAILLLTYLTCEFIYESCHEIIYE